MNWLPQPSRLMLLNWMSLPSGTLDQITDNSFQLKWAQLKLWFVMKPLEEPVDPHVAAPDNGPVSQFTSNISAASMSMAWMVNAKGTRISSQSPNTNAPEYDPGLASDIPAERRPSQPLMYTLCHTKEDPSGKSSHSTTIWLGSIQSSHVKRPPGRKVSAQSKSDVQLVMPLNRPPWLSFQDASTVVVVGS